MARRGPYAVTRPTVQNDSLFIASISNPSDSDFKPAASPTRQVAMMLWVTLYWYFHQPPPSTTVTTEASKLTPKAGKPKGEWRVRVKRDGVLRGWNLIPKLERMGLIVSSNPAVGTALEDSDDIWENMFVTQQMFWQLPGRLFLFTLQPIGKNAQSCPGSPTLSRPALPAAGDIDAAIHPKFDIATSGDFAGVATHTFFTSLPSFSIGPFFSASHLPTY
ncbi:hypothetical protein NEMBOFW57_006208 [Staphylotrichum longicolle]|uniref:Uncharacterized protein n=1 Tax=Staphylotrichum longicolle TaxID=669026 RepID=A0AAD4I0C9_9PEZI|nr:hypothetical protein NEMBOFW57_006208 [Staphylotrichum longicolle]